MSYWPSFGRVLKPNGKHVPRACGSQHYFGCFKASQSKHGKQATYTLKTHTWRTCVPQRECHMRDMTITGRRVYPIFCRSLFPSTTYGYDIVSNPPASRRAEIMSFACHWSTSIVFSTLELRSVTLDRVPSILSDYRRVWQAYS